MEESTGLILEAKHQEEMKQIKKEMNDQFSKIISIIQKVPGLAEVKPEILLDKVK